MTKKLFVATIVAATLFTTSFTSCSKKGAQSDEQVSISTTNDSLGHDSLLNSVTGNVTMKQVSTFPHEVILTGMADHRLVSIYKSNSPNAKQSTSGGSSYYSNEYYADEDQSSHFMPGIDILYGYNLLNIAHYDLKQERSNYFFEHPVLVKTIYYPSFEQDSLDKQPINRDFYLVSAYDEDTNKDLLITKKDLRRLFHFDAGGTTKTQLIPADYSVLHSQYDSKNDVMYVFAKLDENKNGREERTEPVHIFWLSLKTPGVAKMLY